MRLNEELYNLSSLQLAPFLLGKLLCRKINGKIIKLKITETEAYYTEADTACHAHKGKTARTEVMYRRGGCAYVYLCYGIHSLLNIVCGEEGSPQAVLIRGVEGFIGPGKLTKAMQINRDLNGENLIVSDELWLEDSGCTADFTTGTRIGINYASEQDIARQWRFIIKE